MERIPFLAPALARLRLDAAGVDPGPLRPATARRIVGRLNAGRPPEERQPLPGELLALSLLHEAAHLAIEEASRRRPEVAIERALPEVQSVLGARRSGDLLRAFAAAFPGVDDAPSARLEDLLLVHLANDNPAASTLRDLVDERVLPEETLSAALRALERHQAGALLGVAGVDGVDGVDRSPGGPDAISLIDLLREPARRFPDSLIGQLGYVREQWGWLLGGALDDLVGRLDIAIGVLTEEEQGLHRRFGGGPGGGGGEAPSFVGAEVEAERFSEDREWMPRLVLLAKSTYVWLDQLSRRHGREIRTLDAIPDEELETIARRGITGLWLIGLWQRSKASARIKQWRGNHDAVASAYSLDDYRIADDLGGDEALGRLREQAWRHGIRLASDMVPNHMGIDSRWVIDHPERFIGLDEPPYPAYRFEGRNVADDPRVEIRIEDHYWDDSDAAVVFERRDRATGERRYLYHGNDGTSFPWNDTAQLDFLQADVRETVIRTILDVARRFPVIRFDAAMVLARKHVERLWYPEPGAGGGIPSRAEHGTMTKARFDKLMPTEFWRDVVDRVAAEAPDTLLLAEAFWLLEGYFVRTLGMHRVYNSAFMHMIRDEDNAGYRKVIRDTVEFDPAILGRYVNFLTNPDEETAIEQFGTDDKYFGAATMLATLPGLPMIGHGQIEGFTEKYGMEFQRARLDEQPNDGLIDHFEAQIVPLLRDRRRFAGSEDFRLYDVVDDGGSTIEDVFAYSNGRGEARSLVVYHNRFADTAGWIRDSVAFAVKDDVGAKRSRHDTLASALDLVGPDDGWLRMRDRRSGRESLGSVGQIRSRGLRVEIGAYECLVFDELREVVSTADEPWDAVAADLGGRRVPSLDDEIAARRAATAPPPTSAGRPSPSSTPLVDRLVELPDGRRIAVAEWGDPTGRAVFFLHGMPGSRLFCPDPGASRELGVRLIAFDRPGYGGSTPAPGRTVADGAADLATLAAQLGIETYGVIGWSSGGPYALAAAAAAGNATDGTGARRRAVAVIAGDAPIDAVGAGLAGLDPNLRERIQAARAGDPAIAGVMAERLDWFATDPSRILAGADEALAAAGPGAADNDPDARVRSRPEVRRALDAMFAEAGRQGAEGFVEDWIATVVAWGFRFDDIGVPVDLWWGDRDEVTTRDHTDALARLLPAARLTVVPDAGHSLAMTHWREILESLLRNWTAAGERDPAAG